MPTPPTLAKSLDLATRHVAAADARMAALIEVVGPCTLTVRRGRYASLVRAIVGQQVSTAAARTIYGRLETAAGGRMVAGAITALDDATLRSAGLSRQKVLSVRDLTERVVSGDLSLQRLSALADEAVIEDLTRVRGIGRWTAEMFLMFVLMRGDVLPVDDLGIQNAFRKLYRMRDRPSAERMQKVARVWRPWRTVGCWYLWRALEQPAAALSAPRPSTPSRSGTRPVRRRT
ncbi:MAG: DNA-3-methyladenine glycosylase 2 family protein [Deltaproteobacteria bacterium]|nr:DNA-3-methyladenine glycosylase 2 family protein [Deltaproteobacteria bacterium]